MSIDLYSAKDIEIMNASEDSKRLGGSKVEEIKNIALGMGIKKIGIAHCVMFNKEAEIIAEYLSSDFEVFSIGCKIDNIPSSEILGREAKGISCNPAAQAKFLSEKNTELNIVMGLCTGHDIIFNLKSRPAMTTTLLVKDRKHKHNTYAFFESPTQ